MLSSDGDEWMLVRWEEEKERGILDSIGSNDIMIILAVLLARLLLFSSLFPPSPPHSSPTAFMAPPPFSHLPLTSTSLLPGEPASKGLCGLCRARG